MLIWYECRVKYEKICEKTGKNKRVSEPYLVQAISFSEAEERIFKEMESVISGDFNVVNVRKTNYTDILTSGEGEYFYKVRVKFQSIDESKGKEKSVFNTMLVLAENSKDAQEKTSTFLEKIIGGAKIVSINETKLVDVFVDKKEEEEEDGDI